MFSLANKSFSTAIRGTLTLQRLTRRTLFTQEKRSDRASSSFIHPTAIVHPDAVIGQDVSIGPFCTVGSSAKLGNNCQLLPGSHIFGDTELGEHCTVMTGAIVGEDLQGRTVIGCNNLIGHHAVVGVKCQDLKYKPGEECFLDVGDNNDIREYASIHRSSKSNDRTVIGNNNLVMGCCHIAHDCKVGNNNIFANNTLLAGHVVVEDCAHTAGAIVVHQFCQVGSLSFVGGGSVVAQDVPKYMMVAGDRAEIRGLNLEGLRRRGFSSEEPSDHITQRVIYLPLLTEPFLSVFSQLIPKVFKVKGLKRAYQKIFMAKDAKLGGIEDRLADVEQNEELAKLDVVRSMVQSIRESFVQNRRGICRFRRWSG